MQFKMEEKDNITIFRMSGDIDINTSPELKRSFDKIINNKKNKVLIDLKDVGYVDSSGLATLVEVLKKIRAFGGGLALINLSAKVKGLFEITKLDKLFRVAADEPAAVEGLKR